MNCRTHEHRHFERTLRSTDTIPGPRLAEGRFSTPKLLAPLLVSRERHARAYERRWTLAEVARARLRLSLSSSRSVWFSSPGEKLSPPPRGRRARESVSPPWASSEMTRRRARVRRVQRVAAALSQGDVTRNVCETERMREEGAVRLLCSFLRAGGMIEKVLRAPGIPTAGEEKKKRAERCPLIRSSFPSSPERCKSGARARVIIS